MTFSKFIARLIIIECLYTYLNTVECDVRLSMSLTIFYDEYIIIPII